MKNLESKKLLNYLNNYGIKHILAPKSLSAEDMQKAITMFQSQTDIVAFISDAKISKLKFSDFNLPYVIKFDQWWNPISNWEIRRYFCK